VYLAAGSWAIARIASILGRETGFRRRFSQNTLYLGSQSNPFSGFDLNTFWQLMGKFGLSDVSIVVTAIFEADFEMLA